MISLGIESTAHTFGAGIINDKTKVLANVKDSYTTEKGGLIPNEVGEHHKKVSDEVIKNALAEADLSFKDINIISFSQGPGLSPALLVGMRKAKELALRLKVPLVPVNHCVSHLEIGRALTKAKDPVLLYVSGANTQVIAYEGGKYRVFGETLDIGIGNLLDKFARHIGLGFPGGPKIYELALKGRGYIELPYTVKGMDMSFSGIFTALKQKYDSGKYKVEDLCFSLQETAFAMLVEVSERAMAHCNKNELLLGGGVACNKRLQEMCKKMCSEYGGKFFVPENSVLVDNGLMIAWTGIAEYKAGVQADLDKVDIKPYERTDDVEVRWR